jgi:hypothetical protein
MATDQDREWARQTSKDWFEHCGGEANTCELSPEECLAEFILAALVKRDAKLSNLERLRRIAEIIEEVDRRCMAYDGPVGNTREEMRDDEMREIYKLSKGKGR